MLNKVGAIIDRAVEVVVGTLFDIVAAVVAAVFFFGYQYEPEKKKYDPKEDALHRWRRRQEQERKR